PRGSGHGSPAGLKTRFPNPNPRSPTMNAFISAFYRDLSCAAAALLITVVMGASFVQSTAAAPGVLATAVTASSASA
ncbi:MAG TPA: hypothetical protein VF764_10600, partial [Steroidobacteraceae bacterium]